MSRCRGFKNGPAVSLFVYEKRAMQDGGACLSETTKPCLRAALDLTGLQKPFSIFLQASLQMFYS
jgi:hypothetical protein